MRRAVMGLVGGLVLMLSMAPVFADPLPPVDPAPVLPGPSAFAGDVSVETEIGGFIDDLDGVGGATILDQALQALTFTCAPAGTLCSGGIVIEQAAFAPVNAMGIYDLSDPGVSPDRVTIFVGPDGSGVAKSFSFDPIDGTVILDVVDSGLAFGSGTSFGLFIESPLGFFFTEDGRNTDGLRHVLIYHTEIGGIGATSGVAVPAHSYLFAFEDVPGPPDPITGADRDYNDFIYHFQIGGAPVIPEPASLVLLGLGGCGLGLMRRRRRLS